MHISAILLVSHNFIYNNQQLITSLIILSKNSLSVSSFLVVLSGQFKLKVQRKWVGQEINLNSKYIGQSIMTLC